MPLFSIFGLICLSLPFWVLIPAAFAERELMAKRRKLAEGPCPKCSKPPGMDAVKKAESDWFKEFTEFRAKNRGLRPRVRATWNILCPNCGHSWTFYPSD